MTDLLRQRLNEASRGGSLFTLRARRVQGQPTRHVSPRQYIRVTHNRSRFTATHRSRLRSAAHRSVAAAR
jgi:hypothetical protein